jgi:phosphoglycerate dehydrogenase-like enzyme
MQGLLPSRTDADTMRQHRLAGIAKGHYQVQIAVGKEVDDDRLANMRAAFPEVIFSSVVTEPDSIREADAYIGRIPPDVYHRSGERLRWVHSTGAGIETIIAIPELVASDVVVTNTRGAHAPFVAEHTFALMLALNRNLSGFTQDQCNHVYQAGAREIPMDSLYGKRMLILGMGNIGRAIARRALAFEMSVVGLDVMAPEQVGDDLTVLPMDHLDTELDSADVLVIAVPHTAETHNLIDAPRVKALKQGAMVIGISRGRIIDEAALAERLRDGTLAGAGLDVFAEEPLPPHHFLWDTPRLVITPHCAPNSPETRNREFEITHENIRRFVAGEPLLNVCDKVAGF